jgi:CHAT domain-containing protein
MPWLFSGVDLLTLSACNTAASESNGKELDGFSMLAQRRGAKAVLATLWPVADRSTALLMQRFYRARHTNRAAGKAAALRSAQLSLLHSRTFAQPFFWAPFVLSGNWK